jgi:hypothetical protein
MCVHTALKALNWPAVGWVTTTSFAGKIIPPPTGMSLVPVSAPEATPPAEPDEPGEEDAADPVDAAGAAAALVAPATPPPLLVAGSAAAAELLELLAPQAVMAPASPTKPTPASTPRRVASESLCGSCVTTAPRSLWPHLSVLTLV